MKRILGVLVICLIVAGTAGFADAVVLNPGDFAVVPAHALSPGGSLVASTSGSFLSSFGNYSGTYSQYVRQNNNGMLFEYVITNDSTSKTSIASLGMSFWEGFSTDADGEESVLPHADALSRSTIAGDTIHFNYMDDSILPGDSSGILWIQTNAPWYTTGGLFSSLGADTVTNPVFQPGTVPEPTSMLLLGVGLFGIGAIKKLRKKSAAL